MGRRRGMAAAATATREREDRGDNRRGDAGGNYGDDGDCDAAADLRLRIHRANDAEGPGQPAKCRDSGGACGTRAPFEVVIPGT